MGFWHLEETNQLNYGHHVVRSRHHLLGFAGAKVGIFLRTTKHLSVFLSKNLFFEVF